VRRTLASVILSPRISIASTVSLINCGTGREEPMKIHLSPIRCTKKTTVLIRLISLTSTIFRIMGDLEVNIRMYAVDELGDCFLLKFKKDEEHSAVLIDCGSFRNSGKSISRMQEIAQSI